jgi:hypothetical protein
LTYLELDPIPAEKLDSLHATLPKVAAAIEECLDWIEGDDLRARRRRFHNGMWGIQFPAAGSEWLILWEMDGDTAVVRFLGETNSI